MVSISNSSKNNKSLSNLGMTDITVDEATMTVDEAERPVDALGVSITKASKNNKTLSNMSENL